MAKTQTVMARRVKITVGGVSIVARLADTPTAAAIWNCAPFASRANTWGDEVYFTTPVSLKREPGARSVVVAGELAFWTDGDAIAIGFGPTPASRGKEIRLASPANIWARTDDDVLALAAIHGGEAVTVERV